MGGTVVHLLALLPNSKKVTSSIFTQMAQYTDKYVLMNWWLVQGVSCPTLR